MNNIVIHFRVVFKQLGFSDGSASKESACNVGDTRDTDLIPGSGISPGEGNCNPLQYSCLENTMDRGAWQVILHNVAESQTRWKQLNMRTLAQGKGFGYQG